MHKSFYLGKLTIYRVLGARDGKTIRFNTCPQGTVSNGEAHID